MYTTERHLQILIELLKNYRIQRIIVSPGTGVVSLIRSIQGDSFFKLYSVVDERSAGYLACGMAVESGEPVALVCTGATASRNYLPALTEAYYRKIPILAITSTHGTHLVGHQMPQVIDRSQVQNDVAKISVTINHIYTEADEWYCTIQLNKALTLLTQEEPGPVHINLASTYFTDFSCKSIAPAHYIKTISHENEMPPLLEGTIGIFVGAHKKWSSELTKTVEEFCLKYKAIVFCDHTSNYHGKNKFLSSILLTQRLIEHKDNYPDLLIHIGETSGDYSFNPVGKSINIWRVNPDGIMVDTFHHLNMVFKMSENDFFKHYLQEENNNRYDEKWLSVLYEHKKNLYSMIKEFPFSNIWIAYKTSPLLPYNSVVHLGILNSLRSWNFFDTNADIDFYSNTGGFGIDGALSTAVGAALVSPDKNVYLVLGDLAFFYDINICGNRSFPPNMRIIIINNQIGCEFKLKINSAFSFGESANDFIAAGGHYTSIHDNLIQTWTHECGFEYYRCEDKKEYLEILPVITDSQIRTTPLVIECRTKYEDDVEAFETLRFLEDPSKMRIIKDSVKKCLGNTGSKIATKILEHIGL